MRKWICLLVTAGCLFTGCSAPVAVADAEEEQVLRCLILGKDRAAGLTDTVMVMALKESEGTVRILQIPRDTYAAYTSRDYKKLNGALSVLGLDGVKQLLSEALGVPIHYALSLELEAVSALVDAIGGVEVEIGQEMHDLDPERGIDRRLSPGRHRLSGEEAELFLRFRSGYADADLGRMSAQRQFLEALASACAEAPASELAAAVLRVLPHVQTDLPVQEAIRLVKAFAHVAAISAVTAPGEAVQGSSGAWYYSLNRAGMIRAVNEQLLPRPAVGEAEFDRGRLFDRADAPNFHNVYIAPDGG